MTIKVNFMLIDDNKPCVYASDMNEVAPFQQRFKEAMAYVGASTRAAFGALLGITDHANQKLYNWYTRDQRVPDDQRKALAAIGISIDWLNNGEGEMVVGRISHRVADRVTGDGYRVVQLDAEAGMGGGIVNSDNPDVIREVDFDPGYIRALLGFVPVPGRLKLVTGRGDSMLPTILPGEAVIVDTGCERYDGDGIYLVDTGDGQQIKRLQSLGDGVYVVSSNPEYKDFKAPKHMRVGGKVYLRNRIDRLG